jgi:SAM-dependent methyltransferase
LKNASARLRSASRYGWAGNHEQPLQVAGVEKSGWNPCAAYLHRWCTATPPGLSNEKAVAAACGWFAFGVLFDKEQKIVASMNMLQNIKRKLATPLLRKLLRRPGIFAARRDLSFRYIAGSGIEVGALNAPLEVLPDVIVKYADLSASDSLRADYVPDIITDMESLAAIGDASQDFIISNHVIEHVENPLRAIASAMRVLRTGGVAFITLPDKRFTFDKGRSITSLDHLIRDYQDGPDWSLRGHYEDWAIHIDRFTAERVQQRVAQMMRDRSNIHFHVWDHAAMTEMFMYLSSLPEMAFEIAHSQFNRSEVIWILRKH